MSLLRMRRWRITKRVSIIFEPGDFRVGFLWFKRRLVISIPMFCIVINFASLKIVKPTGTLSLTREFSSGIEPSFRDTYTRRFR